MKICRLLENSNVIECQKVFEQRLRFAADGHHIRLVFNEKQDLTVGTRRFSIFPDCLAMIPSGSTCECLIEANVPVQTLAITLGASFIETFLKNRFFVHKKPPHNQIFFDLPEAIVIPMSSDMRQNFRHLLNRVVDMKVQDSLLNEYIFQFLSDYLEGYCERFRLKRESLSFARVATNIDISKRLLLAKEYISNNYDQKFHLDDIAKSSCLSENHLLRTFKKMFGITPYQYLALVRVSRAKSYLEQSRYTINEIVIMVGFESVSSFIRLFKLTLKLTPLQYRKYFQKSVKLIG